MQSLVECIPNFSEGRDTRIVDAIVAAILAEPDVYLLRREMDADHNRSVVTFVGSCESVGEAALRGIGKAAELIDLNQHRGEHPRLGATDVVPFVPIAGVTLQDCVRIAEKVAEQTWQRFQIPTYLYEAAARKPERVHLESIRRGQFEGVREEIANDPHRLPDFGGPELHPTAGASVVGARKFLIAYNINLNTPDVSIAEAVARRIRASGGGFPCVKAMAVDLKARNLAQVSMNLTDFETTSMAKVYEAVALEAAAAGTQVVGSEIVGLVPRKALEAAAAHFLKVENFHPDLILENRLERVLSARDAESIEAKAEASEPASTYSPLRKIVEAYVNRVAEATATPGGGSVAALAGSLAAALGEMVCGVSLKRQSLAEQHAALEAARSHLHAAREKFMLIVDRDAQSYEALMRAMRLPMRTAAEKQLRERAIARASEQACETPLETAEIAVQVTETLSSLTGITTPKAAADLAVAANLAKTARCAGIDNLKANLSLVEDEECLKRIKERTDLLEKRLISR
jgi:glutamate formiminotransferase